MSELEKLKPCPFCGGGAIHVVTHDHWPFSEVRCECCLSRGKIFAHGGVDGQAMRDAISAWNKRAATDTESSNDNA